MPKFPSFSQWKQIFKVLKKKERITLLVLFVVAASSFTFLATHFYITSTKAVPALGGTYVEGIVGQPRFINPIYGETNDIDRALIDVMFSGLMSYDSNGDIVEDLAKTYQVSPDGKTYDITLKDNLYWHDGKPLTVDDVIFTVKTIQTSDYKSPLRANWIDVVVEKSSNKSVTFRLKSPYNSFLENLTLKIIPEHIWQNILPENASVSAYNLQPIGSGPFQFENIIQGETGFIEAIQLTSNRRYHQQPSYISNLAFRFFEKKEDLIKAANAREVNGFTLASLENNETLAEKEIRQGWAASEKFSVYSFNLPRYFAVFFNNQKTSILADANIRKGLSHAVNKEELLNNIQKQTNTHIAMVDSPVLYEFFNYGAPTTGYEFSSQKANELLDKSGFTTNSSGLREKITTKKPAFEFKGYLKVGSKNNEVIQLQACLARLDENFKTLLANETNGTYGTATETAVTEFQKKYLPEANPTGETGAGTKAKLNELCASPSSNSQPLSFTLVTINQPQLVEIANALKNYWQAVGVSVTIQTVSVADLKPIIKNRTYDALLYGEALGAEPDFYPFWHSSQKLDPGLNLSSYENKDVDQLVKEARETLDATIKKEKLEKLQDTILADAPALFLYNPDYSYWMSANIQGVGNVKIIDPAKRFVNITEWFVKTKRVLN